MSSELANRTRGPELKCLGLVDRPCHVGLAKCGASLHPIGLLKELRVNFPTRSDAYAMRVWLQPILSRLRLVPGMAIFSRFWRFLSPMAIR